MRSTQNSLAPDSGAFLLQNAQNNLGSLLRSSLPEDALGFGAEPWNFAGAARWWASLGAGEGLSGSDFGVESLDFAFRDQRADFVEGGTLTGLGDQPFDLSAPAPVSSSLLNAADDLGALDRAFQDFLAGLGDLSQTLTGWLVRIGPLPWVLMGVAMALTLQEEIARRRRQALESKEAAEQLDGDPFSVLVA